MNINTLEIGLADLRSRYNQAQGQLELLKGQKTEKQRALTSAQKNIETWQQVQVLFGKVSEFARQQLKLKIEQTVTAALQAVFERDDISFSVEMKTVGGQPAAEWVIKTVHGDMQIEGEPEAGHGGGIVDVVSIGLRLALIELSRPQVKGPILLDEPAKMVSREYLPNLAQFLKQYCQKTGRQMLIVTHAEPLAEVADTSYRVNQKNGISEVEKV